jgi:hypothetical protein
MTEQPASTVTPFPGTVPGQHQPRNLLDRVRIAIRTRHYSLRTEEAYVAWIRRFIFFHNKRHPAEMGEPEINAFLSSLAVKERVSASTQNQALCALLFLYRYVLEKSFPQSEPPALLGYPRGRSCLGGGSGRRAGWAGAPRGGRHPGPGEPSSWRCRRPP